MFNQTLNTEGGGSKLLLQYSPYLVLAPPLLSALLHLIKNMLKRNGVERVNMIHERYKRVQVMPTSVSKEGWMHGRTFTPVVPAAIDFPFSLFRFFCS